MNADRRYEIAKHITRTAAASTQVISRASKKPSAKEKLADFEYTKKQAKVIELVDRCPWASQYVNIAASLGSMCPWVPYYRGEPACNNFADFIVEMIRPPRGSQQQMRKKSLALQRKVGEHAVVLVDDAEGRIGFVVAQPHNLKKSKQDPETMFAYVSKPNAKQSSSAWTELPAHRLYRHVIPSDEWPDQGHSNLCDVVDHMDMYCCLLEAAMATVEQRKIASSILHLKLDEEQVSEWGAVDPVPDPGDPAMDPETEAITAMYDTWRKAYESGGVPRIAPHPFLWQGDVNLIELGELLPPDTLESLERVARQGVTGLPIPNRWLLEGTGSSNHWGDAELRRELHSQSVHPEIKPHDEFWSHIAFRPLLKQMSQLNGEAVSEKFSAENIQFWELRSDKQAIEVKPDNFTQLLELYKCGVIDRYTLIAASTVDTESLLDIGSVSERDHLLQMLGKVVDSRETPDDTTGMESPNQSLRDPQSLAASAVALL